MLRKPLRGLDGFPLVPRYKPPQMQGVIGLRMGMIERNQENRVPFERVGKELGVRLAHDTHYDALNYEYSVILGSDIHRLDFQPIEPGVYKVTKYVESYPFLPRLFRLLQNNVPGFPVVATIKHQALTELPMSLESKELTFKIKELVRNAL